MHVNGPNPAYRGLGWHDSYADHTDALLRFMGVLLFTAWISASDSPNTLDLHLAQSMDSLGGQVTDANRAPGVDYGIALRPVEAELDVARGEIQIVENDLSYAGLIPWGHRRTYSNLRWYAYDHQGLRWMITQFPVLRHYSDNIHKNVYTASGVGVPFRIDSGTGKLVPTFGNVESLQDDGSGNGIWKFCDSTGFELTFQNAYFGSAYALFGGYRDPAGNLLRVSWDQPLGNAPQKITRVWQAANNQAGSTDMEIVYTYTTNVNLDPTLVTSAELHVMSGGQLRTARRAEYEYYLSNDAGGGGGSTLKRTTIKDGSGNVIGQTYYRYWDPYSGGFVGGSAATGISGMMRYMVRPKTYARLVASSGSNPDAWTTAVLDANADRVWFYDWVNQDSSLFQRVVKQIAHGDPGSDEVGIWQMTYNAVQNAYGMTFTNDRPDYPTIWKEKVKVQRFDLAGNATQVRWIYTNWADQVILDDVEEVGGAARKWVDFYRFDNAGRQILHAYPSAVTLPAAGTANGWDDQTYLDLIGNLKRPAGNVGAPIAVTDAVYLQNASGKIETWSYYSSTTATSTTAGGVAGLVQEHRVQQGEQPGVAMTSAGYLLSTNTYYLQSGSSYVGEAISVPAVDTAYRNAATTPSGPLTTNYSYAWNGTTLRYTTKTTTLPVVATGENGPGSAYTDVQMCDLWGHPTWRKDPDGYVHYRAYDLPTGGVTTVIDDVSSSKLTLPTGWVTPAGGGAHIQSSATVDPLGRPLSWTDPTGIVTWLFYNDATKEYRIYPAWNSINPPAGSNLVAATLRPPFVVRREVWGDASPWRETITLAAPTGVSTQPTGSEAVTAAQVVGLVREQLDGNEHVVDSRAYRTVQGLIDPPTGSGNYNYGVKDTNYEETINVYDNRGRLTRSADPAGTRTWTDYDVINRTIATYTGIDDTTRNQTGSMIYDLGGAGDGNLTSQSSYSGTATYTTSMTYDWRDRQTGRSNPDGTSIAVTLDNLGRITQHSILGTNGVLGKYQEADYDAMGRLYASRDYAVDAGGNKTLPAWTRSWYDGRGDIIKTKDPSGLLHKAQYDGVGRRWRDSTTVDPSEVDTTYVDAASIANDKVVEQTEGVFSPVSDKVFQVVFKRKDGDNTTVGALTAATAMPMATVAWFDGAHRQIGSANYGRDNTTTPYIFTSGGVRMDTNGVPTESIPGGSIPRLPNTSDNYQASKTVYDAAGRVWQAIDNGGRMAVTIYDLLGRPLTKTQNYVTGNP